MNDILEIAYEILFDKLGREPTEKEIENYLQKLEAWHDKNEACFDFTEEWENGT